MKSKRQAEKEQIKIMAQISTSIFLTGKRGVGKTWLAKEIFLKEDEEMIKCGEILDLKQLLLSILNLFGIRQMCDSFDRLIDLLSGFQATKKTFIILDDCHWLSSLNIPTLFPFLIRLADLTLLNLCVVFISYLQWDDLLPISSLCPPCIALSPYSQNQFVEIAALDCPEGEDLKFYCHFAEIVYGTLTPACNDLNEFRYIVFLLFPKYVEPVKNGRISKNETSKLFMASSNLLKRHLHSLYLRNVSVIDWESNMDNDENRFTNRIATSSRRAEMPYMTKFLVIASFLASYNPQRYDARFFTKGGEGRTRVSKQAVYNGSKQRSQLDGPRAFSIDRMLAIFYSIMVDECKNTFDIHSQIASLVSLRILTRLSAPNRLDNIKCKCNVSYAFVKSVAKSINFDISKYLYDWVDA